MTAVAHDRICAAAEAFQNATGASQSFAWERDAIKSWQKLVEFNASDWQDRQCKRIEITLQHYPSGVRRVCIVLGAQNVRPDADLISVGPYFANPCLSFIDPDLKVQHDILRQGHCSPAK